MKKDIHPNYRDVVFMDVSTKFKFMTRSTVKTKDKIEWEDGKEYPLFKVAISASSHPFYTGKQKFVDSTGRIEKFRNRYNVKGAEDLMNALKEKKKKAEDKAKAKPKTDEEG